MFCVIRYVERGSNERSEEHDQAEACSRERSAGAVARHPDAVSTALAQTTTQTCRPAQIIPLTGTELAAKLVVDAPQAEPLASRGVVVIPPQPNSCHGMRTVFASLVDSVLAFASCASTAASVTCRPKADNGLRVDRSAAQL